MKHFIGIEDCSGAVVEELVTQGLVWKKKNQEGGKSDVLANKVIGMIFEKPSTRTRVAFEVASAKLGGSMIFMNKGELQLSRNESIKDTARVLSSYLDGVVIRTHKHEVLEEFAEFSEVPIINALSEKEHPCQTIADLMTMKEGLGELVGKKVAFVGRYNNVSYSLMLGSLKMGMKFSLLVPTGDIPGMDFLGKMKGLAKESGGGFNYG